MTTGEKLYCKAILKPNYDVSLIVKGRGHFYRVIKDGVETILPGVTGTLGIIGGDKTNKLIGWAKKETLNKVRRELMSLGASPVILEPATVEGIIERSKKESGKVLDAAADYGTRLHSYADSVIKGLEVTPEDDLIHSVLAFRDWFKASGIEVVLGDTAVASLEHGYGGKFDAIGYKDGQLGVIDFKTSNYMHAESCLQAAAYGVAAEATFSAQFKWGLIVRFDKTAPVYEAKYVQSMSRSFEGFLAAKSLKANLAQEHYAE